MCLVARFGAVAGWFPSSVCGSSVCGYSNHVGGGLLLVLFFLVFGRDFAFAAIERGAAVCFFAILNSRFLHCWGVFLVSCSLGLVLGDSYVWFSCATKVGCKGGFFFRPLLQLFCHVEIWFCLLRLGVSSNKALFRQLFTFLFCLSLFWNKDISMVRRCSNNKW